MRLCQSARFGFARTSGHNFEMGRKFCYKNHIWGVRNWSQTFQKVKEKKLPKKFGSQPKPPNKHSARKNYIYIYIYIYRPLLAGVYPML